MTPARTSHWPLRVVAALALVIAAFHAYFSVMSGIFSLDEGYLMITVLGSVEGNSLYDVVYTQYGPFYYLYEWLVHAVLRLPITHDATRLLTVVHWLLTASILGVAAGRILKSKWAGLFVFMQSMAHLGAMANEPGHPQELVAVLLALGLFAVTKQGRDSSSGNRWYWLAAIAAALVLIKINVGVLFGLALALAVSWRGLGWFKKPPLNWLLGAACTALPFVLMRRHLEAAWCLNYAVTAACAVIGVLSVAWKPVISSKLHGVHFGKLVAAFAVPVAAILLGTVLTGTTAHGLLDGLVLTPLKTPSVALLPLKLPSAVMLNAIASAILAMLCVMRPSVVKASVLIPSLKGLVGLLGAFAFVGVGGLQLGWLLPWAWLAVVEPENQPDADQSSGLPRVFLSLAAVWQGLQAYPIAGSQVTFATLLLVPVYALCLKDAADFVVKRFGVDRELASPSGARLKRLAPFAGGAALVALFATTWLELPAVYRHFASYESLNLPGSHLMRFDPEGARNMRDLMKYLRAECDTFITYPGYNSFYLWTEKRPPTHLNATGWGLLTHAQQEFILDAVRHAKRPKIVVVTELVNRWSSGIPPQVEPLGKFLVNDCRVVREAGIYTILELKRAE